MSRFSFVWHSQVYYLSLWPKDGEDGGPGEEVVGGGEAASEERETKGGEGSALKYEGGGLLGGCLD